MKLQRPQSQSGCGSFFSLVFLAGLGYTTWSLLRAALDPSARQFLLPRRTRGL